MQTVRRRFLRRKYAKHPSLTTIPEDSTTETWAHSSHYHRSKGDGRLRIILLILFPLYIITTSLMIRTLHRFDRQSGVGQTLQNFKSNRDSIDQIQEIYQHTMSIKRVVYLGSKYGKSIDTLKRSVVESTRHDDNSSLITPTSSRQYDTNLSQHDDHSQNEESPDHGDESCENMAKWQSMSFPTCNSLHEMNVFSTGPHLALRSPATNSVKSAKLQYKLVQDTYAAKLLGNGWFRDAWKVSDEVSNSTVAIKTLRIEREFMSEYYELHRRDAVALERLSESPYVMDIYGFCGQSAVTELAFLDKGLNNLYRMATGMMNNFSPYILRTKLQIAAMTARAVAHVHSVPIDDEHKQYKTPASIVHYDINPRNVIISPSGRPKLNDFNVAEFLTWDPSKNATCGFQGRFREPWWRSPEEMQSFNTDDSLLPSATRLDEKVDVYALGNTLFVLLTGTEPRGKKQKKQRLKQVSQEVADGMKPTFPSKYEESDNPAIVAIRNAITLCWEPDPRRRPSAVEIADQLYAALGNLALDSEQQGNIV